MEEDNPEASQPQGEGGGGLTGLLEGVMASEGGNGGQGNEPEGDTGAYEEVTLMGIIGKHIHTRARHIRQ